MGGVVEQHCGSNKACQQGDQLTALPAVNVGHGMKMVFILLGCPQKRFKDTALFATLRGGEFNQSCCMSKRVLKMACKLKYKEKKTGCMSKQQCDTGSSSANSRQLHEHTVL